MHQALPELGEPLTSHIIRYCEIANTSIEDTRTEYIVHITLTGFVISIRMFGQLLITLTILLSVDPQLLVDEIAGVMCS